MRTICDYDVTGSFHIIITRKMVNWRIGYIGNVGMSVWFLERARARNMKTDSMQRTIGLANRVVCTAKMGVFNHAMRFRFHCYVLSLCESTDKPKVSKCRIIMAMHCA